MAVMVKTRTLRKEPVGGMSGASLNIEVRLGTAVEALGERDGFVEIKAIGLAGAPVGWVAADAVDKASAGLPPLAMAKVAETVVDHADAYGVSAHFLLALSHMRSGLVPGPMGNGVEHGPFGLSAAEWSHFGDRPELGVSLPAAAISEWVSQSVVSALRLFLTQNAIAEALSKQPTAAEMTLALMCGPKTAAAVIAAPSAAVQAALDANGAEDAASAGVDRANLNLRFAEFLSGKTGGEAIAAISAKLQPSLDATSAAVAALGGDPVGGAGAGIGGGAAASVSMEISDDDLDALARVAQSEVGHFKKHGMDQLQGGLSAVVDTVFNRVAHRLFENSIQDVINENNQFSAINGKAGWFELPRASAENAAIVEAHVNARLAGQESIIKGAVNFLNPFKSSKKSMKDWGQFVMDNPVRIFGSIPKQDVHYHGSAPNTGDPADYQLSRSGQRAHFTGEGVAVLQTEAAKSLKIAVSGDGGQGAGKAGKKLAGKAAVKKKGAKPKKTAKVKKTMAAAKSITAKG
jgi:Cell Wall Hydrolase